MGLVDYSDSEDSGNEALPVVKPTPDAAPKPAFQKVESGRIKINLPSAAKTQYSKDDIEKDAPPAKKARMGGGAFSGFNAMLPAPKKPNASVKDVAAAEGSRSRFSGAGLRPGVNLKTSAEPAFVRGPKTDGDSSGVSYALLEAAIAPNPASASPEEKPQTQNANRPQFQPLSAVGRRRPLRSSIRPSPASKPSTAPASQPRPVPSSSVPSSQPAEAAPPPRKKAKVSLFSISQEDAPSSVQNSASTQYQPLLVGTADEEDTVAVDYGYNDGTSHDADVSDSLMSTAVPQSQSLEDIASSLNLTETQRRQLFGKNRGSNVPDFSKANIVEFDTDAEYAHNEKLRAAGETVEHKALKSITGTGKNSLRSLVNSVVTNKEALEETFAAGRRNKREAGNKYGW